MITQTVQYEDLDGNKKSAIIQFHLTRIKAMENVSILDDIEYIENVIKNDPDGEMSNPNKERMLKILRRLMELSYGKRVGERFTQSEDLWNEFLETGQYDEFLFSLFDDPERGNQFMSALMPTNIREEVKKQTPAVDSTKAFKDMTPEEQFEAFRQKNLES